ncbi:MAG TPA: hypothetical protein VE987_09470 [Polyangiaceae bacterium]|nr:hypothetical protein [Polyangiaceae bacterium]
MSALRVLVDGRTLPDDEAHDFWKRFSAWMDAHPGDLVGFARAEGFESVHPEMHASGPVLVASRSAPQRPYGPAPKRASERGERMGRGAPRPGGGRGAKKRSR